MNLTYPARSLDLSATTIERLTKLVNLVTVILIIKRVGVCAYTYLDCLPPR